MNAAVFNAEQRAQVGIVHEDRQRWRARVGTLRRGARAQRLLALL